MKIPVLVFEKITLDEYEEMNCYPITGYYLFIQIPDGVTILGDFMHRSTFYKKSYHSGCRHTWVKTALSGVLDVYLQGRFQKRVVNSVPGEQCTGCERARYV